jgi:hypothetical protein
MAASNPRLGVSHPTVVPTNHRRERDADEAPTDEDRQADETRTDDSDAA